MKPFNELIPEIEAGKVVISLWEDPQACWYRDDRGTYVLKLPGGFVAGATIAEIIEEILSVAKKPADEVEEAGILHQWRATQLRTLLNLPAWHIVDTSFPEAFAKGVTLFSLREELEAGQEVSPLVSAFEMPYCIRKDATVKGFIRYTPSPYDDILATYSSVDELFARHLAAHFPIWMVGKSPAYREEEEQLSINSVSRKKKRLLLMQCQLALSK